MLPIEFLNRMETQLGNAYQAFLSCYDRDEYHGLRLNPLKGDMEQLISLCEQFENDSIPWERSGYYYNNELRPGKHPFHDMGLYYIQEPSAMLPASLLNVEPGQRVLDMCAAPGGKSTQIAGKLMNEGLLVSNEIHPARARILSENIERIGVKNALVLNETPEKIGALFTDWFDRVVVDAPCSGEGMFRKNDDAGNEWSPENVKMCADRQDDILNSICGCLKMGGLMVYSTCTFAEDENEGTIKRFLANHRDYTLISMVRLFPHLINGEGHFAALLARTGEEWNNNHPDIYNDGTKNDTFIPNNNDKLAEWVKNIDVTPYTYEQPYSGHVAAPSLKSLTDKQNKYFLDFVKEAGIKGLKGIYHMFGDNVYLAPEEAFGFKGIKVLRPGLCLGTVEKDRFKPSHSLAMALKNDEISSAYEIENEEELLGYLKGMTFPCGGKGWQLITYKGLSAGWGKAAGGLMKNHYPKGLRRMQ